MTPKRSQPRVAEAAAALGLCAFAHALMVTGLCGLPLMIVAPAGEPYGSWWGYVGGALTLPTACGALAGLLSLIVRLALHTGLPATAMQLRLEAWCLRVTPMLLVIGFSLLSTAMFAGAAALFQHSMEVLGGEQNRKEGQLILGGGAVICALFAIGAGVLCPVFRRRANSLDAIRETHCGQCGYNLSGLNSSTCPECGHNP